MFLTPLCQDKNSQAIYNISGRLVEIRRRISVFSANSATGIARGRPFVACVAVVALPNYPLLFASGAFRRLRPGIWTVSHPNGGASLKGCEIGVIKSRLVCMIAARSASLGRNSFILRHQVVRSLLKYERQRRLQCARGVVLWWRLRPPLSEEPCIGRGFPPNDRTIHFCRQLSRRPLSKSFYPARAQTYSIKARCD